MLLHFFHSLHNAVTQTGSMFSIGTAFTWLPVSYLPAKWWRRNTIITFFPFAFLSPGTKEVTIRTVRRLITCIPYFCHLPAPFLLSACIDNIILITQSKYSSFQYTVRIFRFFQHFHFCLLTFILPVC